MGLAGCEVQKFVTVTTFDRGCKDERGGPLDNEGVRWSALVGNRMMPPIV